MYVDSIYRKTVGAPTGIRTPVAAVKGQCPRPLDDRRVSAQNVWIIANGIRGVNSTEYKYTSKRSFQFG